jgi:putative sterol carrier protein
MEILRETMEVAQEERKDFLEALSPLEGKTTQVRVVGEADFELTLRDGAIAIAEGFSQAEPDATIILPPVTIVSIIEGGETPAEAFFSGRMKVAARANEMVVLHRALVLLAHGALVSDRLRNLYDEFRTTRFGPRQKPLALQSILPKANYRHVI